MYFQTLYAAFSCQILSSDPERSWRSNKVVR